MISVADQVHFAALMHPLLGWCISLRMHLTRYPQNCHQGRASFFLKS